MKDDKNISEKTYTVKMRVLTLLYYFSTVLCYVSLGSFVMFILFYSVISWAILLTCALSFILNVFIAFLISITEE